MSPTGPFALAGSMPWFAWVAITAIVCGSIMAIVAMRNTHRERIEMIRQGMHPDGGKGPQPDL